MKTELRTFDHFPTDKTCIVCHGSEDTPCVLLAKDGTEHNRIVEAVPVHVDCAVATNYHEKLGLIYKRL